MEVGGEKSFWSENRYLFVIAGVFAVLSVIFWIDIGGGLVKDSRSEGEDVLSLPELGVVLNRPDGIPGLYYEIQSSKEVGTVLWMTTPSLKEISPDCYLGIFYKVRKDKFEDPENGWDEEALKAAALGNLDDMPNVKELEDSYFVFEPSQAVCSDGEGLIVEESEMRSKLLRSVSTARLLTLE